MKVQKRRKREHKTDYGKRFKLLKSGKPRIVFRKTNKYIIAQYTISKEAEDKIILGINSKDLLNYGWPETAKSSLKSITASYLTGCLICKKIIEKKLKTPIMDFGMIRVLHKSKVYAFLKGLIDSGIKINCNEKFFPDESKIKGENLKHKIDFNKIKNNINNGK
jgi:large subunit ribosomal protein L18